MAIFDYKCNECGFVEEFHSKESTGVPVEMRVPDLCPKCGNGKLGKLFTVKGQSFDLIGSCYLNDYGKHAWKKNLGSVEAANVLLGERDPY